MKQDLTTILIKSATLLNKSELALYLKLDDEEMLENYQEDLDKDVQNLHFCTLEAYSEIAGDYLPLYYKETITVSSDKFDLNDFAKAFRSIKYIYDNQDTLVTDYSVEDDNLYIKSGTYIVKYRYMPTIDDLYNNIDNFEGKVSVSLMAYGVCAYYCLMFNISEGYAIWETKFKQGLLICQQKTENLHIPARRFV